MTTTAAGSGERAVRKDVARNRARLLAAAEDLMVRQGTGFTLDDVARAAGLGVGTAYRHFANKHALFQGLYLSRVESILEVIRALPDDDPIGSLRTYLYEIGAMQARDRGLRFLMKGSLDAPELTEPQEEVLAWMEKVVDAGHRSGQLRAGVAVTDIPMVIMLTGSVVDLVGEQSPELWRRYLDLLVDALLADGRPRVAPSVPPPSLDVIRNMVQESTARTPPV